MSARAIVLDGDVPLLPPHAPPRPDLVVTLPLSAEEDRMYPVGALRWRISPADHDGYVTCYTEQRMPDGTWERTK